MEEFSQIHQETFLNFPAPQVEEMPSGSCAGHAIWGLTAFG